MPLCAPQHQMESILVLEGMGLWGVAYIAPAHLRQSMQSDDDELRWSAFSGWEASAVAHGTLATSNGYYHSRHRFMSAGFGIV